MAHGTQNRREHFIFVVYRGTLNQTNQEAKTLLFATEDPTVAHSECDRLNDERTSQERYSGGITYRIEKNPPAVSAKVPTSVHAWSTTGVIQS